MRVPALSRATTSDSFKTQQLFESLLTNPWQVKARFLSGRVLSGEWAKGGGGESSFCETRLRGFVGEARKSHSPLLLATADSGNEMYFTFVANRFG